MARLSAKTSVGPIQPSVRTGADESSALPGLAAPALLASLLVLGWTTPARAERVCANEWQAQLVAGEGTVELATPKGWVPLHVGATLCDGDTVRTGPFSRAVVWLPDGNGTTLGVIENATFRIYATEVETGAWYDVIVKLMKGALHVISRDPRSLAFDTPFVNAGIQGTELVIETRSSGTTVNVIEGEVEMSNPSGVTSVTSGTSGFASQGSEPEAAPSNVLDAIGWTRRFPPIVAGPLPAADAVPTAAESRSAAFHARRAAGRLLTGAVQEAEADLATALSLDPTYGDALALKALILLKSGERDQAMEIVEQAIAAAPQSAAAWLVRSLAARTKSEREALESAETAALVAPDHAYAWALVAELRFAREDYRGAREAAERAARLDQGLAYARTVLGFAELGGGSTEAAEAAFRQAVRIDAAAPYAHLGLGLALYRQGQSDAGRREAEIAVALDPTSSVLRSYMGKIYDEENRSVGATAFGIAKALDDEDPTGYFYDALRKQHENLLGDAFLDLQRSFEQTDGRRVHGGRLLLDEDLPARSAGIGRLYSGLGFERLGLLAAWRATIHDPTEYSAHRLAADLYAHRPGRQLARVNQLHQAIMRQPLNVTPMQAQLGEVKPFVHDVAGPSSLALREYNSLLRENGLSYQLSGVTGAHGTEGLDFSVNGLHDHSSYNLSVFDFHSDGFRPNNDFDERVLSALLQVRPNASTTATVELRSSDLEKGDLALRFDPEAYFPGLREAESLDSLMIGVSRTTAKGTWLATAIAERADGGFSGIGIYSQDGTRRGTSFDVQYVTEAGAWNITSGLRYLDQQQTDELTALPPSMAPGDPVDIVPASLIESFSVGRRHAVAHRSAYVYGNVQASDSLWATVGVNVEEVESRSTSIRRIGPKLGMLWDVTDRTTVRAAAMRGLQAPFVSKRNVQRTLEPTHVAGFNQQDFGSEGEEAWRYGIALDHEFAENLFAGVELSRRAVEMPFFTIDTETSLPFQRIIHRDELSHLAYFYWLATPSLSFAAGYEYDEIDGGNSKLPDGFSSLVTHRFPLELNYSHPSGISAGIEARFVDQSGFFSPVADDALPPKYAEDQFWSVDLSVGYRLRSQRGQISLKVLNATDEEFRFQDSDPENPRLFPDQTVQIGFTLSY